MDSKILILICVCFVVVSGFLGGLYFFMNISDDNDNKNTAVLNNNHSNSVIGISEDIQKTTPTPDTDTVENNSVEKEVIPETPKKSSSSSNPTPQKKEIPDLDVNLFKKEPQMKNTNLKDIKIEVDDE